MSWFRGGWDFCVVAGGKSTFLTKILSLFEKFRKFPQSFGNALDVHSDSTFFNGGRGGGAVTQLKFWFKRKGRAIFECF